MLETTENKIPTWSSELIKQLLAYSSILAALSYLLGRAYYQGYFEALGVDISFIQLSWIEYLESGWLFLLATGMLWIIILEYVLFALIILNFIIPLLEDWARAYRKLLGFVVMLIGVAPVIYINRSAIWDFLLTRSFFTWIMFAVFIVLILVLRKSIGKFFSSWKEALYANPKYVERLDRYFLINDRLLLQIGALLIFIITFYLISLGANNFGKGAGVLFLNKQAKAIELVSSMPIVSSTASATTDVYVQDDLRLLAFNNGYYFLSKLDKNCRPQEVFVVDESNIVSIRMTQPSSSQICFNP